MTGGRMSWLGRDAYRLISGDPAKSRAGSFAAETGSFAKEIGKALRLAPCFNRAIEKRSDETA
jgi:hypothetical protein